MATLRPNKVMGRFRVGAARISTVDPKRAAGQQSARSDMRAIIREFDRLVNQLHNLTIEAAFEIAERVKRRADYYVPVATGALKESGYVEATSISSSPGAIDIQVGYGKGDKPDYAVIVHEDLEKTHAPPTQAKFLQQAIVDEVHTMLRDAGKIIGGPFGPVNATVGRQ